MAFIKASTLPGWRERQFLALEGLGLGSIDQVVSTITNVEKSRPSLNNPGNLIYAGQPGASPSQYSFVGSDGRTYYLAQFSSPDQGSQALTNQIQLDASRGMTIAEFTAKYAPAGSGNSPAAYAQYIAQATGLSPDAPLSAAIAADQSVEVPFVGPLPPTGQVNDVPTTEIGADLSPADDWTGQAAGDTNWGLIAAAAAAGLLVVMVSQK